MLRPPILIHPVKIQLVLVDAQNSPPPDPQFSGLAGTPVFKAPMTVTAQLSLDKTDEYYQRPHGDYPEADGHIVISVPLWKKEATDCAQPQKGIRIVQLYPDKPDVMMKVNWHVVRVEPRGHYAGQPWLWFCFYKRLLSESES